MRISEEIERLKTLPQDEPIFILRGQDELAAQTIRYWAGLARLHGVPSKKLAEAYAWAGEMETWRPQKTPD